MAAAVRIAGEAAVGGSLVAGADAAAIAQLAGGGAGRTATHALALALAAHHGDTPPYPPRPVHSGHLNLQPHPSSHGRLRTGALQLPLASGGRLWAVGAHLWQPEADVRPHGRGRRAVADGGRQATRRQLSAAEVRRCLPPPSSLRAPPPWLLRLLQHA
jgi:hypothetical protein